MFGTRAAAPPDPLGQYHRYRWRVPAMNEQYQRANNDGDDAAPVRHYAVK